MQKSRRQNLSSCESTIASVKLSSTLLGCQMRRIMQSKSSEDWFTSIPSRVKCKTVLEKT
jgi:hypothetical protein